uniref:Uncharacterized protein n=1 Tax=Chromera velia CCMP2878 TaxID=1169474 RepID=A0A0G4GHK6_9ALVE|eukprot:Cvel_653.t1-p1 / transcript=Cvel_653.t1 / gene=Cvel_653 / organism=Chromera_velia_CCMP2878 / gene_product=hypothetical protein / transcript_product=hypothetical protein / location=Cvel_scaffold20:45672-46811(+) / protein_length=380 / sequence_SO=supercontig / SO=protein_coding / is_pseudo=false
MRVCWNHFFPRKETKNWRSVFLCIPVSASQCSQLPTKSPVLFCHQTTPKDYLHAVFFRKSQRRWWSLPSFSLWRQRPVLCEGVRGDGRSLLLDTSDEESEPKTLHPFDDVETIPPSQGETGEGDQEGPSLPPEMEVKLDKMLDLIPTLGLSPKVQTVLESVLRGTRQFCTKVFFYISERFQKHGFEDATTRDLGVTLTMWNSLFWIEYFLVLFACFYFAPTKTLLRNLGVYERFVSIPFVARQGEKLVKMSKRLLDKPFMRGAIKHVGIPSTDSSKTALVYAFVETTVFWKFLGWLLVPVNYQLSVELLVLGRRFRHANRELELGGDGVVEARRRCVEDMDRAVFSADPGSSFLDMYHQARERRRAETRREDHFPPPVSR